jgi:hypothetical protein
MAEQSDALAGCSTASQRAHQLKWALALAGYKLEYENMCISQQMRFCGDVENTHSEGLLISVVLVETAIVIKDYRKGTQQSNEILLQLKCFHRCCTLPIQHLHHTRELTITSTCLY